MSKWNKKATEPAVQEITRAWVRETCPIIYIYAPSKTGKTTMLGTLLKAEELRDAYCPAMGIDGDQGFSTIADFNDPKLVTLHTFDQIPEKIYPWTAGKLNEARTAKCGSVFYEGITGVFDSLFAEERFANIGAKGNAARRLHIGPSVDSGTLITFIKYIKQHRIATKTGVPIFISVNCKQLSVDNEKPDGPKMDIPKMSVNLTRAAMRTADAFLELTRSPSGTRFLTQRTSTSPFVALRHDLAAKRVEKELDLDLPGLLSLWAMTIHSEKKKNTKKTAPKDSKPSAQDQQED